MKIAESAFIRVLFSFQDASRFDSEIRYSKSDFLCRKNQTTPALADKMPEMTVKNCGEISYIAKLAR